VKLLLATSVGVLVLEDNFEVLGLGPVTQFLGKTRGHTLHQSLHVLHKRLQGQQLLKLGDAAM